VNDWGIDPVTNIVFPTKYSEQRWQEGWYLLNRKIKRLYNRQLKIFEHKFNPVGFEVHRCTIVHVCGLCRLYNYTYIFTCKTFADRHQLTSPSTNAKQTKTELKLHIITYVIWKASIRQFSFWMVLVDAVHLIPFVDCAISSDEVREPSDTYWL
jgi:hypothetical protein